VTPRLIGIAGPSCAGKGELAKHVVARLGAPVLELDSYYRRQDHLPFEVRVQQNYDVPDALEHELLIEHVRALSWSAAIEKPLYDFTRHTRAAETHRLAPAPYILVEGLFTLHWADLRELLTLKVFIDAPDEVCLARRLERDVRLRGRTPEDIRRQFAAQVQPCAELHVRPTRHYADLILDGTRDVELNAAEVVGRLRPLGA
jgi:uridine kinase